MPPFSAAETAKTLRTLHEGPRILVLPNAWDPGSARIIEHAGFPAIATSSAGIANSLAYPDGERIGRGLMLEAVRRIAEAVSVPVTADMEAGYGSSVSDIEEMTRGVLENGLAGINFEDSDHHQLIEIAKQVERIRAIRRVAEAAGVPLVINARIDTYLLNFGSPEERFAETLQRAEAYRSAGADCVYPIGVRDGDTIARLAEAIPRPINVMAFPGSPTIPQLEQMGVARVTFGSGTMRAAMALLRRIADELKHHGTYSALAESTHLSHLEMNRLMER